MHLLLYFCSESYYPLFRVLLNGYIIFKLESVGSTNEKVYHGKCNRGNVTEEMSSDNIGQSDLKNLTHRLSYITS